MCGRYTLFTDLKKLSDRFNFCSNTINYQKNYNVFPTQAVLAIITMGGERKAKYIQWGLIPSWKNGLTTHSGLINARSETMHTKVSFKHALASMRCLILADGYYEWSQNGKSKIPMRIQLRNGEPFAFAGLWDKWNKPDGGKVYTCAVLTKPSSNCLKTIHHRMPVILAKEDEQAWLHNDNKDIASYQQLIARSEDTNFRFWEVSTLVNSPRNNHPECVSPLYKLT